MGGGGLTKGPLLWYTGIIVTSIQSKCTFVPPIWLSDFTKGVKTVSNNEQSECNPIMKFKSNYEFNKSYIVIITINVSVGLLRCAIWIWTFFYENLKQENHAYRIQSSSIITIWEVNIYNTKYIFLASQHWILNMYLINVISHEEDLRFMRWQYKFRHGDRSTSLLTYRVGNDDRTPSCSEHNPKHTIGSKTSQVQQLR